MNIKILLLGATAAFVATGAQAAMLDDVKKRGEVACGVNTGLPGFSMPDQANRWSGIDVDLCRAVAAAVLGDANKVKFRPLTANERFTALQSGEVDILARNTTWTQSRDSALGITFVGVTYYDGQGFMAKKSQNVKSAKELNGAAVCVLAGTTTELNLTDQMRALGVEFSPQVFADIDPTYDAYEEGRCDAVTSDRSQLVARRTAFANPAEHVLLDVVMSKEPLGPVVPLGDDPWFNVVKWVVLATIEAEELGLTSANVEGEAASSTNPVVRRLLGAEGELAAGLGLANDWVVTTISAVGNYAEIYDRNLGPSTPFDLDRGPNRLWTEGGLLYAPPYR